MDITEEHVLNKIDESYNNSHDTELLKSLIILTFNYLKSHGDLNDWQKSQILYSIASFKWKMYDLSRVSLELSLERNENISQEPWHIKKLKGAVAGVDLDQIITQLK